MIEQYTAIFQISTFTREWKTSQANKPNGQLPFLEHRAVEQNCALAGFEAEDVPSIQTMSDRISANADLSCLLWHCHYLLCHSTSFSRGYARDWTPLTHLLGENAADFFLLLVLSAIPIARQFHQHRGLPETVLVDTYSDTSLWANDYRSKHNRLGIDLHLVLWLLNHLCGELYRLGRLQFIQRPFRQQFRAFRHLENRKIILLAEAGREFRGDGQINGTGGVSDPVHGWTSRLVIDSDFIIGTHIDPVGVAKSEEIQLRRKEWKQILAHGAPILEIHIPAGSPMDFEACGDSFRLALDFFPRYFPDRPFYGFSCSSWLLNAQFQDWLGSDSNMVRFQREFHLFPTYSSGRSGFDRIFPLHNSADLTSLPRDTRLRRAIVDHLQAGGYLRSGGGLLFAEDLDWGNQVYQS